MTIALNEHLRRVQSRLEEYQKEYERIRQEYHDDQTMNFFSDRFGPDHPMSAGADQGVRVKRQLERLKQRIGEFADEIERDYQSIK